MIKFSTRVTMDLTGTYSVTFFVEHEGRDSPSFVGAVTSLAPNTDSSTTPTVLVLGSWNGVSGHRHGRVSGGDVEVEITEVVDEGNDQPMAFLISLPG